MGSEKAKKRMAVILKVRSGAMTVTEGAKALGVSRKTYYVWERRALEALASALEDSTSGRPEKEPDPQEALKEKIRVLEQEKELLYLRLGLREEMTGLGGDKKKRRGKGCHHPAEGAARSGEAEGEPAPDMPDA
jgi:transposase-like protein